MRRSYLAGLVGVPIWEMSRGGHSFYTFNLYGGEAEWQIQ